MSTRASFASLAVAVLLAGCHHATIETGLPAGTTGYHDEWATSWVFGLVPPDLVATSKTCPNGVSKVETQQSFLNVIVTGLVGIVYAPIQIDVTCASSTKMGAIPAGAAVVTLSPNANADEVKAAFMHAAERSAQEGVPVYVRY